MQKFPIVLSLDNSYARTGFSALHSILDTATSKSSHFYQFFILHENLHEKLQEFGKIIFTTEQSSILFIKLKEENIKYPVNDKGLRTLYYKLYIPFLFKDFEKVLYLDSDIIACSDISQIFKEIPDHHALGAVRDTLHKIARIKERTAPPVFEGVTQDFYDRHVLKLSHPDNYFQDGVLLFNIPQINIESYQRFLSLLEIPLWHHAQDILNILFQENIFFLNERWNCANVPSAFRPRPKESPYLPPAWRQTCLEASQNAAILHYRDRPKPWNSQERDDKDLFEKYYHTIEKYLSIFEQNNEHCTDFISKLQEKITPVEVKYNELPVVISFDDNYALYGMTVLQSVLDTSSQENKFSFFIIHQGISEDNQEKAKILFNTKRSRIIFINIHKFFQNLIMPTRWHLTSEVYGRLVIPLLFKDTHYVIYLDSDVVVKKDLSRILDFMDDSKALGATRDIVRKGDRTLGIRAPQGCCGPYGESYEDLAEHHYHRIALGITEPDEHHFQSGVLIFNIPRISNRDIQRCFDLLPQNLWLLDQDILNTVFKGRVSFIDERWNTLCSPYARQIVSATPIDWQELYFETLQNPYILHYLGKPKPWENADIPYASDFLTVMERVQNRLREIAH